MKEQFNWVRSVHAYNQQLFTLCPSIMCNCLSLKELGICYLRMAHERFKKKKSKFVYLSIVYGVCCNL